MKIMFLQLWYDMFGGAETVNHCLATQFKKDGNDVLVETMFRCGKNEYFNDITYKKECICDEPKRPSYKNMLKDLRHLKLVRFLKDLVKAILYYYKMFVAYSKMQKHIKKYNPNWIIITNPMLVEKVPKKYLKRCVLHMHSGCAPYLKDPLLKKAYKSLTKYQNKVYKVIWLTKGFYEESKDLGFENGSYIYNPVRIKNDNINTLESNNIVFLGRIDYVKRVNVLTRICNNLFKKVKDWNLNIYGSGEDPDIILSDKIKLQGPTSDVQKVLADSSVIALTSSSEGFPMVILEAYESGVPAIIFRFNSSSSEVVLDGKTGYIVEMDNEEEYLLKLKEICTNLKLRKEMGKNAKEYVKNFYPENIAQSWYKLFKGEL